MSNEIKEILEEINKIIDNTPYNEDFNYFQVSHISILLDYITNLQQENERLEGDIEFLEDTSSDLSACIKEQQRDIARFDFVLDKMKEIKEGNNVSDRD